ncbi:uncharacterized protein LOC108599224 isoform X2 [Drosophila busckii]|uniref:uncharacterized protein LOC108599224 isoform X2 n=1 Tax=Drosophila busckii TaxID=30019 RepID=UPI00083E9F33|nr:uncharacterized protein LOC108599224 isoform X2 [Drosophila busckii]
MFYILNFCYIIAIATFCAALLDSINFVIKHYRKGIPEIGLGPIDVVNIADAPLIKSVHVGAFWLDVSLTNQANYGFENTTVTKVQGLAKDPTSQTITISGRIPSLVHRADFSASSHIWLVKMNMTGEATSEFLNLMFTLKLKVILDFRNNKRYLRIYELTPSVEIDRWIIYLDGLFRENMDMTITLNRVINERWIEIWNEWEPKVLKIFAGVFLSMVKDIFDRISYDDLFLPDD